MTASIQGELCDTLFKYTTKYRQIYIIYIYIYTRRTLIGSEIVYHSDVVGASPVGSAPTTSSFLTCDLAPRDCTKTTARRDEENNYVLGFDAPYIRGLTLVIIERVFVYWNYETTTWLSWNTGRLTFICIHMTLDYKCSSSTIAYKLFGFTFKIISRDSWELYL